jgi:DNA-binding transcriptional MocR family regulator
MKPTLYGEVADRVLSLIESGTFRAGDKLPSIRTLSGRFAVSVNTVKEAYGLLETQRFLEARPQSGYYVRRGVPPLPKPGDETLKPALDPREVGMCRIYGEVTRDGRNLSGASLAIALPDPDLLPSGKLNAAFQTAWKTMGRSMTDYTLSPGLPLLREQIAQEALQAGVALSPDEIIVTSGTSEALTLALLALCRPGETLAVEAPTYFNFLSLIRELGIKVIEIPTTPDEGVNLEILAWALDTSRPSSPSRTSTTPWATG